MLSLSMRGMWCLRGVTVGGGERGVTRSMRGIWWVVGRGCGLRGNKQLNTHIHTHTHTHAEVSFCDNCCKFGCVQRITQSFFLFRMY